MFSVDFLQPELEMPDYTFSSCIRCRWCSLLWLLNWNSPWTPVRCSTWTTLHDFHLVTLFRLHYLASRLDEFPKRNHNNQQVLPRLDSITNLAIFAHIKDNAPLIRELETRATLSVIISLAIDFPRYFTSYCTLSNTVKAIGIGGTASLFLSVKMSRFLAFFLLGAAWVRSRAERPSVSQVSGQLHVQFGCKLSSKLTRKRIRQAENKLTN